MENDSKDGLKGWEDVWQVTTRLPCVSLGSLIHTTGVTILPDASRTCREDLRTRKRFANSKVPDPKEQR